MRIAVTGATGQLGKLIIKRLKETLEAEEIIAIVRNPDKATELDVEVKVADYQNIDALKLALINIDKLIFVASSEIGMRIAQHKNVIDAASETGVDHIIYTSLLHADTSPMGIAKEHYETELYLKKSGVNYTILRNGWYTENYTGSVPTFLASGIILGSAGNGRISSATRADYADAAVAVSRDDSHKGAIYELSGDSSFTLKELADEISKQTGKDIIYRNLAEDAYKAALLELGIPDYLATLLAEWDNAASKDALYNEERILSKLIQRPTTPMSQSVRKETTTSATSNG